MRRGLQVFLVVLPCDVLSIRLDENGVKRGGMCSCARKFHISSRLVVHFHILRTLPYALPADAIGLKVICMVYVIQFDARLCLNFQI